ncbi:YopX family protein [Streptococcus sp. WB01_FAA12]|uniref:YopX family protein n=1 Tax=Streptococcus sp. WB01_FAA12 TaxID=2725308 RepID=UPI001F0D287C|nr:YopX family protein [Streptococcus sp. WB01_FAA12]
MLPRFRAWYVLAEEMINEILMISFVRKEIIGKFSDGSTSVPLKFEDKRNGEDVILMQSTGLCDKEGTEVFEGDILHHQIQKEYTFIVKYDKEKGCWYGDGLSRTYRIKITKEFLPYYKVIGNIYENKNLLEVENEN